MVPMMYQCSKCHKFKMEVLTYFRGKMVCRNCKTNMLREEEAENRKKREAERRR